jgi:hypothetical protein
MEKEKGVCTLVEKSMYQELIVRLDGLKTDVSELKTDVSELKTDV